MTTPAVREHQSPLEAVLVDVRTTLADLLVAADEQHAAVVARDHDRLESVTRQQERLSARLARAEATRRAVLNGETLDSAIAATPRGQELHSSIALAVRQLKQKQAQTTSLLEQSVELTTQTLNFLQRLVTAPNPVYGARGLSTARHSVLVDSRA
jgi:flagellar biosynthesis/type III secretory pathway chaperone